MKKDLDNNDIEVINNKPVSEEEYEITDLTDMRLYGVLNNLDKICALLDKLLDDYMFCDDNEPQIAYLKDQIESSAEIIQETSTEKWVRDYNTIYQFMDIIYDYADRSRNEIEDILFDFYDDEESEE